MFVEMAGSLTRRAFFMVVFLNFLHPDCSKRSFFQSRLYTPELLERCHMKIKKTKTNRTVLKVETSF